MEIWIFFVCFLRKRRICHNEINLQRNLTVFFSIQIKTFKWKGFFLVQAHNQTLKSSLNLWTGPVFYVWFLFLARFESVNNRLNPISIFNDQKNCHHYHRVKSFNYHVSDANKNQRKQKQKQRQNREKKSRLNKFSLSFANKMRRKKRFLTLQGVYEYM